MTRPSLACFLHSPLMVDLGEDEDEARHEDIRKHAEPVRLKRSDVSSRLALGDRMPKEAIVPCAALGIFTSLS